jgi:hypothetical protein
VVKAGQLPLNLSTVNGIDKIEGKQSNCHFTINEKMPGTLRLYADFYMIRFGYIHNTKKTRMLIRKSHRHTCS